MKFGFKGDAHSAKKGAHSAAMQEAPSADGEKYAQEPAEEQTPPVQLEPVEDTAEDQSPASGSEPVEEPAEEQAEAADEGASAGKKNKAGKIAGIAAGAVIAAAAAVYLGGVGWFSYNFMPNTILNGQDVSGLSAAQVAQDVQDDNSDYATFVHGDGIAVQVTGKDIDFAIDTDAYTGDALAQAGKWVWPYALSQQRDLSVEKRAVFSADKLDSLFKSVVKKANKGAVEPSDATVVYSPADDKFIADQENPGTKVDRKAVVKTVAAGVEQMRSGVTLGRDELKQPKRTRDDKKVQKAVKKANKYVAKAIPLKVKGKKVLSIKPDQISKWIDIDDEKLKVSFNEGAVDEWVRGEFVEKCCTLGGKRSYTVKIGKSKNKVSVSGGTYGWMVDIASFRDQIIKRVKKNKGKAIDVPMLSEAATWNPGGKDWPKRYIDIDLSQQYAWMFDKKGKVIWESEIVSGKTDGHETPTGVYVVNSTKGVDQILIGSDEDGDGEPDYRTPVNYWIPFVGNSVALHDATWRGSFGGSIYTYDGSHGCVNLPYSKAQELYNLSRIGDVVSCHY